MDFEKHGVGQQRKGGANRRIKALEVSYLNDAMVPSRELVILAGFGLAWGGGAVLFGLGMDMLGLTLGYPLIMGLNASVGTFVPLLWLYGSSMFAGRRLLIAAGAIVAIAGISVCSFAGARRESAVHGERRVSHSRFVPGLLIAVASGFLSCLVASWYHRSMVESCRHA